MWTVPSRCIGALCSWWGVRESDDPRLPNETCTLHIQNWMQLMLSSNALLVIILLRLMQPISSTKIRWIYCFPICPHIGRSVSTNILRYYDEMKFIRMLRFCRHPFWAIPACVISMETWLEYTVCFYCYSHSKYFGFLLGPHQFTSE